MSTRFGGIPIVFRMFQRELRSRESKAALMSMANGWIDWQQIWHMPADSSQNGHKLIYYALIDNSYAATIPSEAG